MMNIRASFIEKIVTRALCALLVGGALVNCVSVNIPANKPQKSDVTVVAPTSPFTQAQTEGAADAVWRNSKNGNNISYLTQCGDKADPELESIRHELALGLAEYRITGSQRFPYNSREALRSYIIGKVDGIETHMDVVIFKKNGCIYTLTLVGVANRLEGDTAAFNQFINGFKAP